MGIFQTVLAARERRRARRCDVLVKALITTDDGPSPKLILDGSCRQAQGPANARRRARRSIAICGSSRTHASLANHW